MSGDTITIIRARHRRLAKAIGLGDEMQGYDEARTLDLHRYEVASLAGLHRLLDGLLRRPDCCVVRGEVLDLARVRGVRRLLHRCPETGDEPTLRDVPRRWLALDLDGVALPPETDPRDLAACARAVLPRLPGPFGWAACIAQASASHGIKPGARLRLWFWLDRPLSSAEATRWMRNAPVDRCLFRAAQPIYTAAPVFRDGRADHLPTRLLALPGEAEVRVPPPAYLAPPRPPPHRPIRVSGNAEKRVDGLLRTVRGAKQGERNFVLFWGACRAGELVREGLVDAASMQAALVEAAMRAGGEDRRKAEQIARGGIARGKEGGPRA
jgi:hypothetical protein